MNIVQGKRRVLARPCSAGRRAGCSPLQPLHKEEASKHRTDKHKSKFRKIGCMPYEVTQRHILKAFSKKKNPHNPSQRKDIKHRRHHRRQIFEETAPYKPQNYLTLPTTPPTSHLPTRLTDGLQPPFTGWL